MDWEDGDAKSCEEFEWCQIKQSIRRHRIYQKRLFCVLFYTFLFSFSSDSLKSTQQLQKMRLDKFPFVLLSVVKQESIRAGHHEASTVKVALKNLGSFSILVQKGHKQPDMNGNNIHNEKQCVSQQSLYSGLLGFPYNKVSRLLKDQEMWINTGCSPQSWAYRLNIQIVLVSLLSECIAFL